MPCLHCGRPLPSFPTRSQLHRACKLERKRISARESYHRRRKVLGMQLDLPPHVIETLLRRGDRVRRWTRARLDRQEAA